MTSTADTPTAQALGNAVDIYKAAIDTFDTENEPFVGTPANRLNDVVWQVRLKALMSAHAAALEAADLYATSDEYLRELFTDQRTQPDAKELSL